MGSLVGMPEAAQSPEFSMISAADIMNKEFTPLEFIVQDILPKGFSFLGGKPKSGKSLLATHLATCVATGSPWGELEVEQGDVLYLALEDNQRRLQSRFQKMALNKDLSRLQIVTESMPLDWGFLEATNNWIAQVSDPRLVIIDTYAKIKPRSATSKAEYDQEYATAEGLLKLSNAHDIAVLAVHHQKKGETEDPFDGFLGSTGITAAADTLVLLQKTSEGPVLIGKGRDIAEFEYAVELDERTLTWSILGPADEARMPRARKAILEAVGKGASSPKEVAVAVEESESNVRQTMSRMATEGQLRKVERGNYRLPD